MIRCAVCRVVLRCGSTCIMSAQAHLLRQRQSTSNHDHLKRQYSSPTVCLKAYSHAARQRAWYNTEITAVSTPCCSLAIRWPSGKIFRRLFQGTHPFSPQHAPSCRTTGFVATRWRTSTLGDARLVAANTPQCGFQLYMTHVDVPYENRLQYNSSLIT